MQPTENPTRTAPRTQGTPEIQILADGDVARRNVDYALRRLRPVIAKIDEPVLYARVKLSHSSNAAQPRPARAQVVVDIHGDLVRAQVAEETMAGAVDMLKDRLRDQLKHRSERRKARRRRPPASEPGTWRRGDLPGRRPVYYQRPIAEREVVRRKSYSIGQMTPDDAIGDMEQLDYDFYLFQELATGEYALVVREDDESYGLLRLHPSSAEIGSPAADIHLADVVPARQSVEEAVERIRVSDETYLFFENDETGQGNVLYRRYDGHYGLITPD